jgi:hypothetical protein
MNNFQLRRSFDEFAKFLTQTRTNSAGEFHFSSIADKTERSLSIFITDGHCRVFCGHRYSGRQTGSGLQRAEDDRHFGGIGPRLATSCCLMSVS